MPMRSRKTLMQFWVDKYAVSLDVTDILKQNADKFEK